MNAKTQHHFDCLEYQYYAFKLTIHTMTRNIPPKENSFILTFLVAISMCKNRAGFLMPKYTVMTLQLLLKGNTKWRVPELTVSVCTWDPDCQALSVSPCLRRTLPFCFQP